MKKPINEIISTSLFLDEEIIQPPPILTIDNKTIATEGNFITISGQPKSRKTTFAFFMIASGLLQKSIFNIQLNLNTDEKIILIDTEQSIFDFARQIKILKFTLKCKKLPLNLTELVINPNDIPESKKIIQFLKRITAQYNCCIITLLHNSKSTNNTLGNLGSYADRGAQSTLRATIDKDTDIFTLEPVFMRSDAYFKPINVFYNKESNKYEQTETAPKKESKKFNVNNFDEADHINRIGAIFRTQKEISYAELVEEIKQIYGIGTNGAKQKIIPYLTGNNFIKSNKGIYTRITNK